MSFYRTPDGTHYHINMGCKHIAGNPNVITCDGSDGLAPCTDCVLGGNRGLGDGTPVGGGATLVVTGGGGQYRLDHPDMTGMHYERHGGERVAVPDGCHLEGPDGMLVDEVTERLRQELRKLNEETDWQALSDYDRNWRPPERDAFDMSPAPERPHLVEDRKAEIRGIERQISARQMQLSQHGESIARMTMEQDRERTQAPTPEEVIEDVASDATENPRGVIARGERLTSQGRGEASRPLPSGSKGIKGLRFIMESRHMLSDWRRDQREQERLRERNERAVETAVSKLPKRRQAAAKAERLLTMAEAAEHKYEDARESVARVINSYASHSRDTRALAFGAAKAISSSRESLESQVIRRYLGSVPQEQQDGATVWASLSHDQREAFAHRMAECITEEGYAIHLTPRAISDAAQMEADARGISRPEIITSAPNDHFSWDVDRESPFVCSMKIAARNSRARQARIRAQRHAVEHYG